MIRDAEVSRFDFNTGRIERKKDVVAREVFLHVFLSRVHFVSFLCSPKLLKELIVGYLIGEGVVNSIDKIDSIDFDDEDKCFVSLKGTDAEKRAIISKPFSRLIVSACGSLSHRNLTELLGEVKVKPLPSWKIDGRTILECVKRLNLLGEVFRKTGGVHVGALFYRDGKLIAVAEDIGRHNAVDKVIGSAALESTDLGECFLALSGRLSGDVVLKAVRAGIPIVASLGGAIDSGVIVADWAGLTLVGFVRASAMVVYCHPERVSV